MSETKLIVSIILVAVGMVVHYSAKLRELEEMGQPVSPGDYLKKNPWTAVNVVLGAYGLFLLQWYTGEGVPIAAFLTGVACNAAGDKLRARANAKMQ
jgi:hypothetical protein